MKRTSLALDEKLLKSAKQLLGAKTYSAAVNQALAEVVRTAKIRGLAEFFGTEIWEGDFGDMREDRKPLSGRRQK